MCAEVIFIISVAVIAYTCRDYSLLTCIYVSILVLLHEAPLYERVSVCFTLFSFAALAGWSRDRLGFNLGPLAIPCYFILANVASLVAFHAWGFARDLGTVAGNGSAQTVRLTLCC